jgi:hypothetical protein
VTPISIVYLKRKSDRIIQRPAPSKTVVIIAAGPLDIGNGLFATGTPPKAPSLRSGESIIVSGDIAQHFTAKSEGGGIGVLLKIKYKGVSEIPV